MNNKEEIFNSILELLNTAYEADPAAIHALICNRVPCNEKLADHKNIIVEVNKAVGKGESYNVGMLGVLVGIIDALTNRKICAKFDEGKLVGFGEYKVE